MRQLDLISAEGWALSHLNEKRFMTDTERIVKRHLENKEDVITDDDIRGVHIFIELPSTDTITKGAEAESHIKEK